MLKIAIIGPESTGKTELCEALASHYRCKWESELAREFVENLGREYTFDDVVEIATLQVEQEKKYENIISNDEFVFFDTDLIITKVWFAYKYKNVPDFVEERLSARFFDFYLLTEPDLPWVYDPVREHGDDREFFFDWYENEIKALGTHYTKVGGVGDTRVLNAIKAIDEFQKNCKNNRNIFAVSCLVK